MIDRTHTGCPISDAVSSRLRGGGRLSTSLSTFVLLILLACAANAQGHGGGGGRGPGGGGIGGGINGRGMNNGSFDRSPLSPNHPFPPPGPVPNGSSPTDSTMSGGLQLGPSGRWWDNKDFARTLGIDSSQQHRMDDVFSGNRNTLLKLYKSLQHEESQLAKTVRAKELDEAQILAQIDRVTQARGELEKANAHMLLQLRKELTPDQTAKLDDHRPNPE